jgi:hypothetical protein
MALADLNRARTSVRVCRLQTTCREKACRAPEEVEALKGSMKRSPDWLKMKNPDAPAVKREAEEDWTR